jgi:hypothetical protein
VLQNRHALDLLTVEKGGMCFFLNEECCFYATKSGVVRDMARQLKGRVTRKETRTTQFMVLLGQHVELVSLGTTPGWSFFYAPSDTRIWPCIIRLISQQVQQIKLQLLVKEYSPLPVHEPSNLFYQGPLETTSVNPREVPPSPHPISPTAVGCLSQRGNLLGLDT